MNKRFTALRIIGTVFKVLAWIALIFGILSGVLALIASLTIGGTEGFLGVDLGGPLAAIAVFIVALIVAIFQFLMLYAVGESIYVFLSIEENTRRTAYLMQQQYMSYQSAYAPTAAVPGYEDD